MQMPMWMRDESRSGHGTEVVKQCMKCLRRTTDGVSRIYGCLTRHSPHRSSPPIEMLPAAGILCIHSVRVYETNQQVSSMACIRLQETVESSRDACMFWCMFWCVLMLPVARLWAVG